ncbi:MAG: nucleoside-triphosphatase [Polyangiaceae bacterium]
MKRWALVQGGKAAGKSTAARRVAERLEARGVPVAGFFQEAIEEDGDRIGYRLRRIGRNDAVVIAKRGAEPRSPSEEAFCSFVFDNGAFEAARAWLSEDAPRARVIVLDEISKLEVAGKGHHDAVLAALARDAITVLAVRADQLFYVMERFGLEEPVAGLEASPDADDTEFVEAIARAATGDGT